ncbi:response regulator transcription factor [Chloroflexia bacterium SDU3-3]|nr:response regulator transcription factor [Chloroflexia bacterium SDU3-3]
MAPIRILLADDHRLFRAGVRALLQPLDDIVILGEASDGPGALELIDRLGPDVVLMDIAMAGMSGLDVAQALVRAASPTRVIFLSMHANEEYVVQALRVGAAGYVLKDADTVELELAIRAAARGDIYLSPFVSRQVVESYVQRTQPDSPAPLSIRQREILRLIAEGHSTQEIALQLGLSAKTVEKHRAQLMERLGIYDIAGLVRYAIRARIISVDG